MARWLLFFSILLGASAAHAQPAGQPTTIDPLETATDDIWGGGCIVSNHDGLLHVRAPTCRLSVHFSLGLVMTSLDLVTYKAKVGSDAMPVGPCYGITYQPKRWYASGLNVCLSVTAGQDLPSTVFPSVVARFLKWGAFGAGPLFTARTGGEQGMSTHWILLSGANVPIQ